MIDIHSHILPGVDDGPASVRESIRMILEAERVGVTTIYATPHLHGSLFSSEKALEAFIDLKARIRGCGVSLALGYEVFIDPVIIDLIRSGRPITLGDSRYLLIELPYDTVPLYSYEIIYQLHLDGIIPIIAHPERNIEFTRDINKFVNFVEKGCLVQIDAGSLLGAYGHAARAFANRLIAHDLVDFIASDAHYAGDYHKKYAEAYRKILAGWGDAYARRIFDKDPEMIANGHNPQNDGKCQNPQDRIKRINPQDE